MVNAAWNALCRRFLLQSPAHRTEAMLADFSLVIWSVQGKNEPPCVRDVPSPVTWIGIPTTALAGLVAASREEDRYGVVQRSDGVRRTLYSLIALDLALEAYCALPLPLPKSPLASSTTYGRVRPHPHAITTGRTSLFIQASREGRWAFLIAFLHDAGVESAVYQVVTAFYDHLATFKFPPAYARKLQSFADFQQ